MPLRAKLKHDGVASCSLVPLRTGGPRPPIVLTDPSVVIGSGSAAQIRLKSSSVSKAHALILVEDGKAYVRDLASRTQLYVNDEPVREAFLGEGDVVRVGRFGFGVHENAAAQARPHDRSAPVVRLRISDTGTERVVGGPVILIGRRHGCDVIVPDHTLSGAHAVLFHLRGQWWVRDLGSRAGTMVNGAEVRQQRALSAGDLLKLGSAEVVFLGVTAAGTAGEPETAGLAASEGTPAGAVESAGPVDEAAEELQPAEMPGSEPAAAAAAAPLHAESGPARAAVFADAPIAPANVEEPPPPPPPAPAELPVVAELAPPAPGGNGWDERSESPGGPGDELAPPAYRNGNDDADVEGDDDDDDDDDDDYGDEAEDEGSSGAVQTQVASEKEWDEAVTVWSFAELAKRGGQRSRDDVQVRMGAPAAAERRRWLWVTVGAAIACVAVLVTLMAHKLW